MRPLSARALARNPLALSFGALVILVATQIYQRSYSTNVTNSSWHSLHNGRINEPTATYDTLTKTGESHSEKLKNHQTGQFNYATVYPTVRQWSEEAWESELQRKKCIQSQLESALGWLERGPLFFLRGCNNDAVLDFEQWIMRSSCEKSPIAGDLIFHVGWTGPWLEHFLEDMYALLDSFLATQDTSRSVLLFWLMDRDPDSTDPLIKKYSKLSNGRIVFRRAVASELSKGTCLAQPENQHMWTPPGDIQPQTKSDLLRILLLYKFGGIWIDTDTILLRDMRPLAEYVGGFGGRFAMNQKFNNAMLALRQGSPVGLEFLNLMCKHPKATDRASLNAYCAVTGQPCNPHWWYNHNLLQWATRRGSLVAMPLQYFDPGNNCASRGLLSRSGSQVFKDWSVHDSLELVRGAYALHTRSYQAKERPLSPNSVFAQLFELAKNSTLKRTQSQSAKPLSIVPYGRRNATETQIYKRLLASLDSEAYPDPPFFPPFIATRVHLQSVDKSLDSCLAFDTKGGRKPYEKPMLYSCTTSMKRKDERAVFLWHDGGDFGYGYLRPSFTRCSNVFCVSVSSSSSHELRFQECDPEKKFQQWVRLDSGRGFRLQNNGVSTQGVDPLCLGIVDRQKNFPLDGELVPCSSDRAIQWNFVNAQYIGDEATLVD